MESGELVRREMPRLAVLSLVLIFVGKFQGVAIMYWLLSSSWRLRGQCLLAILFVLSASVMAEERERLNPDSILNDIQISGAAATVKRLNDGEHPQWAGVLQMIETGDPHWLSVAGSLAAGTDAATSEDLQVVLAKALPINPQGVLSLADNQTFLSIENLCIAPFIEPELDYLHRYLAETLESLRRLKNEAVEAKRKRCLAQIERVIAEESARK